MVGAEAEELHGVADLGVAGFRGNPLGPLLDLGSGDFDAAPADPADDVVVVIAVGVGLPAQAKLRLAVGAMHHVGESGLGEQVEISVDRGQPHAGPALAQFVEKLLGGAEAVGLAQYVLDGRGLTGAAHATGRTGPRQRLSHTGQATALPESSSLPPIPA